MGFILLMWVSIAFRRSPRSPPFITFQPPVKLNIVSIAFLRSPRSPREEGSCPYLVVLCLHCLSAFSAFTTVEVEVGVEIGVEVSPLPFGVLRVHHRYKEQAEQYDR